MGDRWNINNDEEQRRRYREETPRWRRVLDTALMIAFVVGVPSLILAVLIYGRR